MKKHPNKEIQDAINYALEKGWLLVEAGKSSHAFCRLLCPFRSRDGCKMSVWSSPRSAFNHANQIIRIVDKCGHQNYEAKKDI